MPVGEQDDAARANSLRDRVTIAVATALPKELAAVELMLDGRVDFHVPGRGAGRAYTLGEVPAKGSGTHVVAVFLADQGNSTAAAQAALVVEHFQTIEVVLMVGIAGGVPNPGKVDQHVRLGDVVVSGEGGVVNYAFVKQDGARFKPRHPPRPPDAQLLEAARRLEAAALRGDRPWERNVERASGLANAARPDVSTDMLFDTTDPSILVPHPADADRVEGKPRIFLGTIASADRLLKDAATRDALRDQHDVRAVEMESFGVAEATWKRAAGFFTVRGICDYCDGGKNDTWQAYAAVIAAAYARALLGALAPIDPRITTHTKPARFYAENVDSDPPTTRPLQTDTGATTQSTIRVEVTGPGLEAEHQAQLDQIRSLITSKGQPRLAMTELAELQGRIWAGASPSVRARIVALGGIAKIEVGEVPEGARCLIEALSHAPTDAKVQANAAYGHSLLGNSSAAVEWARKALALDPTNTTAIQVAIQFDDRSDDVIVEEYERVVGPRAEVAGALAQRASMRGERQQAVTWLERAAVLDPASVEIAADVGQAILGMVVSAPGFSGRVGRPEVEQLERAADLLSRSWKSLQTDDLRRARVNWLLALTNVHRLLQRSDASSLADEALRVSNRAVEALQVRSAIASEVRDYAFLVTLLEPLRERSTEHSGLLATAFSNLRRWDEALAIFRELLDRADLETETREQCQRNLALTLLEAGRLDEARTEVVRIVGDAPDSQANLLLAIEVYEQLGERETRDTLLDRAVALTRRATDREHLLRLGDLLLRADRPGPAADVYALAVVPTADDRSTRRFIEALYRAGRFDAALSTCSALTASVGRSRFCTETVSVIHEQLGNLDEARRVCEDYIKEKNDAPGIAVRLGLILLRSGDVAALRGLLGVIDLSIAAADIQLAAVLSHLLAEAGRPIEALDVLFEMRRKNLGKAPAHLTYIGRFITLSRDLPRPTVVAADVAVKLTGVGAPGWILISSAPDAAIDVGEYPVSHPTAQAALGKRVGDIVTFAKTPDKRWTVEEIDPRHAFAYRQSLEVFPARFPDDPSLEQHAVPDDTREFVETIRQRLLEGEPRSQTILRAYGEGRLTIGAFARISNRSPAEAIGVVATSEHGLIACANSGPEKKGALGLFKQDEREFVADYTALFILHELGLLQQVASARRLIVARSTVDEVRQELLRWKSMPGDGEHMTLGIRDGEVVRHVTTPEDVDRRRNSLEAMVHVIGDRCMVVGVEPAVAQAHANHRQFGPLIGESFWHTILLCSAPSRALLSDDLWLRRLAASTVKSDGICTAHLLLALALQGSLDRAVYSEALVKLIASGYRHVATDGHVLEAAARLEGWRPQGAFTRCSETLRDADLASAVVVAVEFFRLLWFALVLPDQRNTLCNAIMSALITGRRTADVLTLVRAQVSRAFALIPIGERDMQGFVDMWERLQLVR